MTSFERTMAAIQHMEPDRVPLFLLLSHYGAKEADISIKRYFSSPSLVASTQLRMKEKYRNDCLYAFSYGAAEVEAFGGEVVFVDDGPPNSGEPFIRSIEQLSHLQLPVIDQTPCLKRVLDTTAILRLEAGTQTPIIGVVMSPFSLPVMQMGFEHYLEMMYFQTEAFEKLMRFNQEFCVAWANAQLEAGATAICYFDPLASPTIIERDKYLATGHRIAKQTLARIKGPTATHLASAIVSPVLADIVDTGTAVVGISSTDDLDQLKRAARNRICLLGNLNGLDMIGWDTRRVHEEVRQVIEKAGSGGGLILSDNHGEIPWQVPESVLLEISEAILAHGVYPLRQTPTEAG